MGKWAWMLGLVVSAGLACDATYPIWIPRSQSADAFYRFEKDDKAGYIDRNGKIVIPPVLNRGSNGGAEFHDGLLEIDVSNGHYVDTKGKLVIDGKSLYRGWDFSEALAVAMRKNESQWGYIDRSGKFAISPRFKSSDDDYVWPFAGGFAKIKVQGKYGYIDHSGEFVLKPQFPDADDFSDGMARIVLEGPCTYIPDGACGFANAVHAGGKVANAPVCKFTFIDMAGRVVSQDRYDFARSFAEGLAPVRKDSRWGFIDKTGKLVIGYHFEDAQPFSDGLARVRQNGSYGYIDHQGKLVIPPWFEFAEDFADGLAPVGNSDEGYWYIDKGGHEAFPHRYVLASPFFKGLAHVQLIDENQEPSDTFAYIDISGKQVFAYQR